MAAATERIRIGTAICLLVERDPIITAKQVASLDRLSGGRFLFGIGAGWNLEEMRSHGTEPDTRFRLLRERVEACKALWAEEVASYHGEFVDFDEIVCRPAPLQQPHPPIMVGGNGPTVHRRVLAYGDAWFPNRIPPDDAMIARVEELQRLGEQAGRGRIPVTIQIPPKDLAVLERYEEAGVTRAVHMLRAGDAAARDSAERKLDEWAARIQAYTAA
jgi:probable F420-dependent oxidoreductase